MENEWIDVSTSYWEMFCCIENLRKNWGFIPNRKHEQFVVNIVFHAKDIPNSCVTFLEDDGGYAIVASLKHEDVNYKA